MLPRPLPWLLFALHLAASVAYAEDGAGLKLCSGTPPRNIDSAVFAKAMIEAEQWALPIYGDDCVLCVELLHQTRRTFQIHITSPDPRNELWINTSAVMTFDNATGRVLDSGVYHSCHVRRATEAAQ
jgi:hypothetical protein